MGKKSPPPVECARCGHSEDDTYEFDMLFAKAHTSEAYEPGKCTDDAAFVHDRARNQLVTPPASCITLADMDDHIPVVVRMRVECGRYGHAEDDTTAQYIGMWLSLPEAGSAWIRPACSRHAYGGS